MKRKSALLASLFFIFAFSAAAAVVAQSVVITPKKTVYRRPKPLMDFKKSFTVTRPQIKGLSSALNKKTEAAISYERVLNLNIREELGEIQWLEEAGYEVNYNKNGILDITLSLSGSAAYPSVFQKTVVVDLKTGRRVRPSDVFTNLNGLAAVIRKAQQAEMKKAAADYKKDPDAQDFDASEYFERAKFTAAELEEFTVGDKGVTFIYDYRFPHVARALQPDGRFFYTWAQLRPFIKPAGLLARFVR